VNALIVFDDGTGPALYAGGAFTTAGGVSANRIAKWNGSTSTWSALGGGIWNSAVFSLAVFGLYFRAAVFMVLSQAGRTFNWQLNNTALPAIQKIADFSLKVIFAGKQAFSMSQDGVRRELEVMATNVIAHNSELNSYAAAGNVISVVVIIIIIIIAIIATVFTGGTAAVLLVSVAVIAASIAVAFNSGASADTVVRAGLELFRNRARDLAEAVCKGWYQANNQRPPLRDLVKALHRLLSLTADQITDHLLKSNVAFGTIADALIAEFGRDANMLARAFKAAGAGARDVALALKNEGFSVSETGSALKDVFGSNNDQLKTELQNAGYGLDQITQFLSNLSQQAHNTVESIINNFR
jgi:hypothetical protein